MDRYLFSGALLLLILEITVLLMDLGLVTWPGTVTVGVRQGVVIGELKRTEKNVRRRLQDSIVWQESQPADTLFAYDSILTLARSSAQIDLDGDVRLHLDENTLVVLEPSQQAESGSLHLRFSKGTLNAQNPGSDMRVQGQEWALETSHGSELNVRSLQDGRVELELSRGSARLLTESADSSSIPVMPGERITLEKNQIIEKKKITEQLQWSPSLRDLHRKYAYQFPVAVPLEWTGAAQQLRLLKPDKSEAVLPLDANVNQYTLLLDGGTYLASLENKEGVSRSLVLQVRTAEAIRVFNPLPRDRVRTDEPTTFSWENKSYFARYRLGTKLGVRDPVWQDTDVAEVQVVFSETGEVRWNLRGYDSEGFEIPPFETHILYSVPQPLAAPILNEPKVRAPASQPRPIDPPPNDRLPGVPGAHNWSPDVAPWRLWWSLAVSKAWAQTEEDEQLEALFSWQPVAGATRYIVEISTTPSFASPVLIQKVSTSSFVWRGFEKRSYYWRVAAEGADQQMGYFSPPAWADLTRPNEQSGVTIRRMSEQAAETKAPTQSIVQPSLRSTKRKTESQRSASKEISLNTIEKPEQPGDSSNLSLQSFHDDLQGTIDDENRVKDLKMEEAPRRTKVYRKKRAKSKRSVWKGRFFWQPQYQIQSTETDQNVRGSFVGFVPMSFGWQLEVPLNDGRRWFWLNEFERAQWKPKSEQEYPFQDNLVVWEGQSDVVFQSKKARWAFGGGVERRAKVQRVAFETISTKDVILLGPSAYVRSGIWEGFLSLRYGDSTVSFRGSGGGRWKFGSSIFGGVRLGFGYATGSAEYQRWSIEPRLLLGWEW